MSLKKNKTKNERKEIKEKELDIENTTEQKKSSSGKSAKQDTGIVMLWTLFVPNLVKILL